MSEQEQAPKLHIDSDWKAQAQEEKRKLAEQAQAKKEAETPQADSDKGDHQQEQTAASGDQPGMPPANFETLLSTMATQALFAMGAIADPRTGKASVQPDIARHHIDMLGVIEQKTKGNLSEQESELLSGTLQELRNHYVQVIDKINQASTQAPPEKTDA